MKIEGARLQRYELSLREPWRTAKARTSHRTGYLLGLRGPGGLTAWGDAAPLPGSDASEIHRCGRDMAEIAARAWGEHRLEPPLPTAPHPAARHAWVQTILTLEAQTAGRPLAALFGARLGTKPAASVPVNATLGHATLEETVASARKAVQAGYSCLKIKVGNSMREVQRVAAVREAVGGSVALRVDANGSWDEHEAPRLLEALEPLGIEYVEQPLPPARLHDLQRLRRASRIPLAVDESARHLAQALGLIDRAAVDVLVLKPMALGGIDHALELARRAHEHSIAVTLTDSVESAVGRTAALHLAAALPGPPRVHGLASGEWMERDVVPGAPAVHAGRIEVPTEAGLGLSIDVDVEGRA